MVHALLSMFITEYSLGPREYGSPKQVNKQDPVKGGSSDVFWSVTENHDNVSAVFRYAMSA